MIYAPIKYKKIDVSSPLYLNCLSYSIAPISAKKVNYNIAEENLQSVPTKNQALNVSVIVEESKNASASQKATFDNIVSEIRGKYEIKPICKQATREKIKNFGTDFSQKFDALFGEKLNATKEKVDALINKMFKSDKEQKIEDSQQSANAPSSQSIKVVESDESVKESSVFSKFKTKIQNMLNKEPSSTTEPANAKENLDAMNNSSKNVAGNLTDKETTLDAKESKTKETLAVKIARTTTKIKEFLAQKKTSTDNDETVEVDELNIEENKNQNGKTLKQRLFVITHLGKQKAQDESSISAQSDINNVDASATCNESKKTTRKIICKKEENGTYKRKSYYAIKVENAKNHIINAGRKVKDSSKKFVSFLKEKLKAPKETELVDEDDYTRFGFKKQFINNPTTSTLSDISENANDAESHKSRMTTLDDYFEL